MIFYLGTHRTNWLGFAGVPLFVSDRRLRVRKSFPRAAARWALDSGGFTELTMHGRWKVTPQEYAERTRVYRDEIGSMDWASPQDWMCEPEIIRSTGLSVAEHQRRTIDNFLELRAIAPDVPWIPVVQGWKIRDYLRHVEDYDRAGVDLTTLPTVGVGTVCRRQSTSEGVGIICTLASRGLWIHAYGFKYTGLPHTDHVLASADSMAWSLAARHRPPMAECVADPTVNHQNCANCFRWAMRWRDQLLNRPPRVCAQVEMFDAP